MKFNQKICYMICGVAGICWLVFLLKKGSVERKIIGVILAFSLGCFCAPFYKSEDNDSNNNGNKL